MRTVATFLVLTAGLSAQFVPADFKVPVGLMKANYKLVPLGPALAKHDYEAYMSSIEHLRATFTNGSWPHGKLTMADAVKDVEGEEARFKARRSFTYAVLTPDGSKELGCVYIAPSKVPGYDASVRLWVTKAEFDKGLEKVLIPDVKSWLTKEWPFQKVIWPGRG